MPAEKNSLPRNIRVMGAVSFANDAASEMIYPLLPVYLTQVLGASPAALGLIEGVAESSVSFFKLISGYLSDRFHRRKSWILAGYLISNAVRPLIALARAWPFMLFLRFADRMGKGLRTSPRDALLAESIDPGRRGEAFGFHRAMDHAGAVVGPLIAWALLAAAFDIRSVFWLSAVPGVFVLGLIVFGLREPAAAAKIDVPAAVFRPSAAWRAVTPEFRRYLALVLIFSLGNASDAFLLLKCRDMGVPAAALPLLWSAHHVVKSATTYLGGRLSDRMGRKALLLSGWFLNAGVFAGFAFFEGAWAAWALMGFYGLFFGLTEGVERALVADLAPGELRGSAFGLFHSVVGVASLLASVGFGLVWKWSGDAAAFALGAGLAASAAAGLGILRIK